MTALVLLALAIGILAAWVSRVFRMPGAVAGAVLIAMLFSPLPAAAGALDTFITAATPGVVELIGLALTGIIGWVAARARQKWGIEIEARHREALQSALLNGARLALTRQLTGKAAVDLVLAYIRASVPDAIGKLHPTSDVLTDLARAKLEEAAAERARGATGAAVDALTGALKKIGIPVS